MYDTINDLFHIINVQLEDFLFLFLVWAIKWALSERGLLSRSFYALFWFYEYRIILDYGADAPWNKP